MRPSSLGPTALKTVSEELFLLSTRILLVILSSLSVPHRVRELDVTWSSWSSEGVLAWMNSSMKRQRSEGGHSSGVEGIEDKTENGKGGSSRKEGVGEVVQGLLSLRT